MVADLLDETRHDCLYLDAFAHVVDDGCEDEADLLVLECICGGGVDGGDVLQLVLDLLAGGVFGVHVGALPVVELFVLVGQRQAAELQLPFFLVAHAEEHAVLDGDVALLGVSGVELGHLAHHHFDCYLARLLLELVHGPDVHLDPCELVPVLFIGGLVLQRGCWSHVTFQHG